MRRFVIYTRHLLFLGHWNRRLRWAGCVFRTGRSEIYTGQFRVAGCGISGVEPSGSATEKWNITVRKSLIINRASRDYVIRAVKWIWKNFPLGSFHIFGGSCRHDSLLVYRSLGRCRKLSNNNDLGAHAEKLSCKVVTREESLEALSASCCQFLVLSETGDTFVHVVVWCRSQ
jgi:hypothetical protein